MTLQPIGPVLDADWDVELVTMFRTQEALAADLIQHVWQRVVEPILLLHQFLVQNLFLLHILLPKDMAPKLLPPKHCVAAPPEKELSRLNSTSTRAQE